MTDQWFYRVGGTEVGPVSTAELRDRAKQGEIRQDTPVRRGDMVRWIQAVRVRGLVLASGAQVLATASAAVPPDPPLRPAEEQATITTSSLSQPLANGNGTSGGRSYRIHPQRAVLLLIMLSTVVAAFVVSMWTGGLIESYMPWIAVVSLIPMLVVFVGDLRARMPVLLQLYLLTLKGFLIVLWLLVVMAIEPVNWGMQKVTHLTNTIAAVPQAVGHWLRSHLPGLREKSADSGEGEGQGSGKQGLEAPRISTAVPFIMVSEALTSCGVALFGAFLEYRPQRRRRV